MTDRSPLPPAAAPAWVQGFAARVQGFYRLDNPYLDAVDEREDQWDDGWLFAQNKIHRAAISRPETRQ
jgi:hypothetical protein